MNQTAIFAPFLATMLLTLIVWFYMYAKRIPLIQRNKIDLNSLHDRVSRYGYLK